jgi:hypothetical protein
VSGSYKGRVLMPKAARPDHQHVSGRQGTCAWCGETCYGPKDQPTVCPRCGSDEIDWVPPIEPPPAPPHRHFRDEHIPGSIAYALLAGGKRHGE